MPDAVPVMLTSSGCRQPWIDGETANLTLSGRWSRRDRQPRLRGPAAHGGSSPAPGPRTPHQIRGRGAGLLPGFYGGAEQTAASVAPVVSQRGAALVWQAD